MQPAVLYMEKYRGDNLERPVFPSNVVRILGPVPRSAEPHSWEGVSCVCHSDEVCGSRAANKHGRDAGGIVIVTILVRETLQESDARKCTCALAESGTSPCSVVDDDFLPRPSQNALITAEGAVINT